MLTISQQLKKTCPCFESAFYIISARPSSPETQFHGYYEGYAHYPLPLSCYKFLIKIIFPQSLKLRYTSDTIFAVERVPVGGEEPACRYQSLTRYNNKG